METYISENADVRELLISRRHTYKNHSSSITEVLAKAKAADKLHRVKKKRRLSAAGKQKAAVDAPKAAAPASNGVFLVEVEVVDE